MAANVAAFVLLQLLLARAVRLPALYLSYSDVMSGKLWQVVTYAFLNPGSIFCLVFNMLFLWWLGRELEALYGPRRFLRFYLGSALAGAAMFMAACRLSGVSGEVFHGASGPILAVTILYAFHYPRQQILFYGIIPIEIRWLAAIYVLYCLWPVLQGGAFLPSATDLGAVSFAVTYAFANRR